MENNENEYPEIKSILRIQLFSKTTVDKKLIFQKSAKMLITEESLFKMLDFNDILSASVVTNSAGEELKGYNKEFFKLFSEKYLSMKTVYKLYQVSNVES